LAYKIRKSTLIFITNLKIIILLILIIICFIAGLWIIGLVLSLFALLIFLYQKGLKQGEEQKKGKKK
jgi:hypothetical protein